MTTVERVQQEAAEVIRTVGADLDRRGVLMLTRAEVLLSGVKRARLTMSLVQGTTPTSFLNAKWRQQAIALSELETRLGRIIRGTRVPPDDHEATTQ